MHVAVFGSTGFLGQAICLNLTNSGWKVTSPVELSSGRGTLDSNDLSWLDEISEVGPLDGIVWAQGKNASGTVLSTPIEELQEVIEANVLFIASTLKYLGERELIGDPCRAVVLSSVWQNLSRSNKFSYLVSKSALAGLVGSIAVDMASGGLSINAVLPGVVDSPMTKSQLSIEGLRGIQEESMGGKLVSAAEVAEVVSFLVSQNSSGINGQSIVVDHAWSGIRHVRS